MIRRKDIIFRARDWNGREVILDKRTYRDHIARFHLDAAMAVQRVKDSLSAPTYVVECRPAKSENAIYPVAVGDHPWLVVAIKPKLIGRIIATWYSATDEDLKMELRKGKLLWPKNKKK